MDEKQIKNGIGGDGSSGDGDLIPNQLPAGKPEDWIDYFKFKYSRDTASDARNALLVVAALLVQVTYQAGINPPDYISETPPPDHVLTSLTIFLVVNTLSLSASMTMIEYLTANMPYQRELRIAMGCMMFGYGVSVGSTRPVSTTKTALLVVSCFLPFVVRFLPNLCKKMWKR